MRSLNRSFTIRHDNIRHLSSLKTLSVDAGDPNGDRTETQAQRGSDVRQGNCTPCAGRDEASRHADEGASSVDLTTGNVLFGRMLLGA
jgi:hypothetical protein